MKPIKNSYAARHPDRYQLARDRGFPAMARILHYVRTLKDAACALGYASGSCYSNLFGPEDGSRPGADAERRAAQWLASREVSVVETTVFPPKTPAPYTPGPRQAVAEIPKPQPAPAQETTLLVVCPADKAEKLMRVIRMMGAEVEDV